MFFGKPKDIIGLDIGSSSVKLVKLKESGKSFQLERFGIQPLATELIVDGTIMDAGMVIDAIKALLAEQKIKTKTAAISLSGNAVIVKKITLPAMSEDELAESIKWEAEQYIPFDINDVNVDFQILGSAQGAEGQPQINVVLVAVKKDKLNDYTALVTEAGLDPLVVDIDAFAIENMYGINYDAGHGEITALINIGASIMNINILKDGTFAFARDISIGGNRYTETIQKELGLSYEEAEKAKKGEAVEGVQADDSQRVINTVSAELASEITRSFDFFRTTSAHENIDKILISGGCSMLNGIAPFLSDKLGIGVELANPFKNIKINPKDFDPEYIQNTAPIAGVAVGLAMRRVGDK